MADERDLRIGKNEILYRAGNEEVHGLDARLGAASLPTQSFLCECASEPAIQPSSRRGMRRTDRPGDGSTRPPARRNRVPS